jgi:phosphatidylserine decarboxylase
MTIHREGYKILIVTAIILILINVLLNNYASSYPYFLLFIRIASVIIYFLFLQFFRLPKRNQTIGSNLVIAPADGKVVVIEDTEEKEFFKDKRLMLSIFMSPINVHCNWYPVTGKVTYVRYHKGKYLVAWHPKASTENERTTVVIQKDNNVAVLVRQIAGAVAKRIIYYAHENDMVTQGGELGFIKFGSRVDVYLPLNTKVNVKLGDITTGGVTVLAEFK